MQHISTTPFGRRPVTAGLLAAQALAHAPCPVAETDKWSLFHDLRIARTAFGVTDRDLTVLNALLSFLPARTLTADGALIVHPSNASLSDRAHGMAESTLRRHLAALVAAGLIARHDSPNGKRYVSRGFDGDALRVFGFDLRPLLVKAPRIAEAAIAARRAARNWTLLREQAVLRLRDADKLVAYAAETGALPDPLPARATLAEARAALRRRLIAADLQALATTLEALAGGVARTLEGTPSASGTKEMDANAAESERHQQNSNAELSDLEPCPELGRAQPRPVQAAAAPAPLPVPLMLVLKACPDIQPYAPDGIHDWRDLIETAARVRALMGISPDAWQDAAQSMGPAHAAICVAAILQRVGAINSPGGYLRALTDKSRAGAFSTGPMVMALLSGSTRAAAA